MHKTIARALAGAGAAVLAAQSGAFADPIADFYKGTNIRLLIGAGVGGGNDTYARTFARHYQRHIPGKPRIVSQNRPGAGGIIALNYLYNKGPQDGSYLGVVNRSMLTYPLMDGQGVQFDINRFKWLGSLNGEVSLIFARSDVPVRNIGDLRTRGLIVAGTAASNDSVKIAVLLNNVLGTKFDIVAGYPSGEAMNLAVERKEVEGRASIPWTTLKATAGDWLKEKKIRLLLQFALKKHPELPDVPLALDLVKTDEERRILELHSAKMDMGRPYLAPPKIPADRLSALRKAFDATVKDPLFMADATRLKLELGPIGGEEMQATLARIYATPKAIVDKARAAYNAEVKLKKAKIPIETLATAITGIKRDGRRVIIQKGGKAFTLRVSGSKTKVSIAGKKAKRGALKTGMSCTFKMMANEAQSIDCK